MLHNVMSLCSLMKLNKEISEPQPHTAVWMNLRSINVEWKIQFVEFTKYETSYKAQQQVYLYNGW